jgi:hypothetical protein
MTPKIDGLREFDRNRFVISPNFSSACRLHAMCIKGSLLSYDRRRYSALPILETDRFSCKVPKLGLKNDDPLFRKQVLDSGNQKWRKQCCYPVRHGVLFGSCACVRSVVEKNTQAGSNAQQ